MFYTPVCIVLERCTVHLFTVYILKHPLCANFGSGLTLVIWLESPETIIAATALI